MDKVERAKYKKRIHTYEKLGALEFQEVVFTVERLKFKAMKKVIPNFPKLYDNYCERKRKQALKHATAEEQRNTINRVTALYKADARIEFNEEKNRNYHMNTDRPTEIYEYLKWNKSVHVKGMITDIIFIIATSIGIVSGVSLALLIPALFAELLSFGINFECVNIQNYNMCRYKLLEETIVKKHKEKTKQEIEKYGDIAETVHKSMEKTGKMPSIGEILKDIPPEKRGILKEFLQEEIIKREKEETKQIQKAKTLLGGNK